LERDIMEEADWWWRRKGKEGEYSNLMFDTYKRREGLLDQALKLEPLQKVEPMEGAPKVRSWSKAQRDDSSRTTLEVV